MDRISAIILAGLLFEIALSIGLVVTTLRNHHYPEKIDWAGAGLIVFILVVGQELNRLNHQIHPDQPIIFSTEWAYLFEAMLLGKFLIPFLYNASLRELRRRHMRERVNVAVPRARPWSRAVRAIRRGGAMGAVVILSIVWGGGLIFGTQQSPSIHHVLHGQSARP